MQFNNKITIIGAGFCGMITALNLAKQSGNQTLDITLIHSGSPFGKGVAYNPNSDKSLLNVPCEKMSCFFDQPNHFLDWTCNQVGYELHKPEFIAKLFLPRALYGKYLLETWNEEIAKLPKNIAIRIIEAFATDINEYEKGYAITLSTGIVVNSKYLVLATGNEKPGNPVIENKEFFESKNYFQNPWDKASTSNLDNQGDILVIGNGLTMVDTVMELCDNKFRGRIFTISPNGFSILPHRHSGTSYTAFSEEIKGKYDLNSIYSTFINHSRKLRELGISAEPITDSLRPFTQNIWINLSVTEKKRFLSHVRHLWGLARHRLPIHIHDQIQKLRIDKKLEILKGRLIDIKEVENQITVEYYNKVSQQNETLTVSRIINCTGPQVNVQKSTNPLLKCLVQKGMIQSDLYRLGIVTTSEYEIVNAHEVVMPNLFTLGGNLRGMLWETTAVPELKKQCHDLSSIILSKIEQENYIPKPEKINSLVTV
jgi:uncharacterized NAD(P)/FAD-binding protein YdhS